MSEKIIRKTENKVSIVENAIVNNGKITLFFLVNLYNYDIYSTDSINGHITRLYNMITNFENQLQEVKFSIFKFEEITSPDRFIKDFIRTVKLWSPDFNPSPEFIENIDYNVKHYCVLALNVDKSQSIEFEDMQVKELVKTLGKQVVDYFAVIKQQNVDVEGIKRTTSKIENQGQGIIVACPSDILLNYYVKRMFPSYNLVIDQKDFESTNVVISYLRQNFIPHFNYFEMDNAGVEYFGAKSHVTYGTIIDIIEMPEEINSDYFSLNHSGLVINAKTLSKQKARLQFKRTREDVEYERESAENAGSKDINLELDQYSELVEKGLALASAGRKIVEADMHILILAKTVEELNKKRFSLMSTLKNMNIICTFNSTQAKTYVDSFVKLRPVEYPFLFDLRYCLSFQLNSGVMVGDGDDPKFTSPVIGESTTISEATQ